EGNWTLYRQNTKGGRKLINEWIFEDNVLKSICLNRNDTVYEVQIAEAGLLDSEEVILPLNENFLNIIELKAKIYNEALIEQYQSENSISNLYFNLISKLDLLDQNLSPIVKTSIKPEIRSKIMALPLNKTEEELFTEISELLDSNKLKTQSILNNPQINISSISNKKVEELKYVLERINQLF